MNRRDFVRTSAVAVAGTALVGVSAAPVRGAVPRSSSVGRAPSIGARSAGGSVTRRTRFEDGRIRTWAWEAVGGARSVRLVDGRVEIRDVTSGRRSVTASEVLGGRFDRQLRSRFGDAALNELRHELRSRDRRS